MLVSLTTLAALAVVATFCVFAAGAMQLEVLGLFRRDFAFHHEAGFHLVPAGAVACALHGWLPLYCGLVAAAALGVFFLAIYARSLVGRLCFWLRRARKIDVDAALIAAASGSECAICFEDPAQLLVFLPCGHRCVCASCAGGSKGGARSAARACATASPSSGSMGPGMTCSCAATASSSRNPVCSGRALEPAASVV